ncbi:Tat pathway signal sequence domain protein [Amycolatopsis sp. NBC_01488]|uniref:LamG-like jellyroll fold domain-containing protein n=1 Tax=Amycolatopsis sp. NBC_01488 TaxID=2903563 RepID=UPI002E2BCE9D|nr:LamG-like jellyroll fold domain-containing protein [Amycolatopsis sp. NBC_01488]
MTDTSRRNFLLGAGAAAAATLPAVALGAPVNAAEAQGHHRPDAEDPRFTLVVMPDTQYLFDEDRGDAAPLDASLRYVLDESADNVVFLAHLGDLTQNGRVDEFSRISKSFQVLDRRRFPYSTLAGNHDIDGSKDDQRGPSPYLDAFGPQRQRNSPTFKGASKDGYNTYHVFRGGGREWLLLALDWRPSAGGLNWAKQVLAQHPTLPAILTIHELVWADDDHQAQFSTFGELVWKELVDGNDQIFLTLNGHYWPTGRTVRKNAAGHDVHVHIANYQDRYYGGSAMVRLYQFDLARGVVDVRTFSPWLAAQDHLSEMQQVEVERSGAADYFSLEIDFAERFKGFAPVPVPPGRPAKQLLVPGTVAYWRFEGGQDGVVVPDDVVVRDQTGRGNDLTRVTAPGSGPDALKYSSRFSPRQPSRASLSFDGGRDPSRGAYLRTVDAAPMNELTFERGYTVEAFFWLPANFKDGHHGWCGLFARQGSGAAAGKTGDDPKESAATLSLSDGGELQWAVFPLNQNRISTSWGHELPVEKWWHVAVVNDGRRTTVFVDGCPVVRNPATPAVGLANPGGSWLVGASSYEGKVDRSFAGLLGDVRVVDRPLNPREFMLG